MSQEKLKTISLSSDQDILIIRIHKPRLRRIALPIICILGFIGCASFTWNFIYSGFRCDRYVTSETYLEAPNGITYGVRLLDFACGMGGLGTDVLVTKYFNGQEINWKYLVTLHDFAYPPPKFVQPKGGSTPKLKVSISKRNNEDLNDLQWYGLNIVFESI